MARSSPRCPGTVTNPRFAECLNCRWLPRVRAWYQPSDSSSRMTSRTFMGLTHLRYIPLCITTKLSRGQAAKRVGRRLERRVRHRDLQEGLRVLVRDGQQSFGWTRWNAAALFPLLECPNRHAKQTCELRLRQTDLFSGRRHRWEVLNTTDLASLELANALQNIYANAAMLVLRHLRISSRTCFRTCAAMLSATFLEYRVSIQITPRSGRRK